MTVSHRRWLGVSRRHSLPFVSARANVGDEFRRVAAAKARSLAGNYSYSQGWAEGVASAVRAADDDALGTFLVASAVLSRESVLPDMPGLVNEERRGVLDARCAFVQVFYRRVLFAMACAFTLSCLLVIAASFVWGFWHGPRLDYFSFALSILSGGAIASAACGRLLSLDADRSFVLAVTAGGAAGVAATAATWFIAPLSALAFWFAWTVLRDIEDRLFRLEEVRTAS